MRVAGIHVAKYRGMSDLRLPLRSCNVLIGANGAGKSTLLEAMGFEPSEEGARERLDDPAPQVHWYFEPDDKAPLLKALRSGTVEPKVSTLAPLSFALRAKALGDRWELAIDLFALIEGEVRDGQRNRLGSASVKKLLNPLAADNPWVRDVMRHIAE